MHEDGLLIEELKDNAPSDNVANGETVVKLPADTPGRLSGPQKEETDTAIIKDGESMKRIAMEEAERVLPAEMEAMLHGALLEDAAEMCGCDRNTHASQFWESFAASLVDLLWAPLAGCTSCLKGCKEPEVRTKLQLFWRCSVAMCMMPLAHLTMMSQRKKQFLHGVEMVLPEDGSSPAVARLVHTRLNLPLFAMVAKMPSDERDYQVAAKGPTPATTAASVQEETATPQIQLDEAVSPAAANSYIDPSEPQACSTIAMSKQYEEADSKRISAAKHTYDIGYSKWDKFDVDNALCEVDHQKASRQNVKVNANPEAPCDDPVEALHTAIQKLKTPSPHNHAEPSCDHTDNPSHLVEDSDKGAGATQEREDQHNRGPAVLNKDTTRAPSKEALSNQDVSTEGQCKSSLKKGFLVQSSKGRQTVPVPAEPQLPKCEAATGSSAVQKGFLNSTTKDKLASQNKPESEGACVPKKPSNPQKSSGLRKGFFNAAPSSTAAPAAALKRGFAEPECALLAEGSGDGGTAEQLNQDYKKWDDFGDYDDVSDDEDDGAGGFTDLDAMTGPKEEIQRIQAHWKRSERACRKAVCKRSPRPPSPSLPKGKVIARPCEYKPQSHPELKPVEALNHTYNKWKEFDADGILLDMDNDGKTEEGNAVRCEARQGNATLTTEGYKQDREEYEIDQEIDQHMGGLKKMLGQRIKDGAGLKAEGNSLWRAGRVQDACEAYQRGIDEMELCSQATVIMSDSLGVKCKKLISDLHRNMAAAQLDAGDFNGAVANCNAALKIQDRPSADDDKAYYRRALALMRLGRLDEAQVDIDKLSATLGEKDAAVKRLRAEALRPFA